ncbi:hypothetical protein E1I69_00170 [Bacillus timonensis]|uniref:Fimbrial assembly protein n=1 Tax=Bacillus timonensis TaxID=1033734 RepID=A0A4S3PZB5_9BACI|nr:hypothetical protein [Bacillus timonensis]THE15299.1 hypothetical protein E1I69_00170 [Bacillus timonensis]
MLVDINLLPRKEFKNRAKLLLLVILIIVALIGFLFIFIQYKKATTREAQLTEQITTLQETRAAEEQKYDSANQFNNVVNLERTVEWADSYFVKTVPILNHLTMLLPERGFVQNFSYTEDGIVSLEVQFDTNTENAYYLALLTNSPLIKSARLLTVSTTPITETSEGVDTTTDTNSKAKENEATTDNKIESEQNNNILPRYFAQYEIIFDKSAIKSLQEGN